MMQQDFDGAEQRFRQYLELAPDHPRAHNSMGVLMLKRGQEDEAAVWFERALEVEPRFTEAQEYLEQTRGGSEHRWG